MTVAFRCDEVRFVEVYNRIRATLMAEQGRWRDFNPLKTPLLQNVAAAIELATVPFQAKVTKSQDIHLCNGSFEAVMRPSSCEISFDFKGSYWMQGNRPEQAMDHAELVAGELGWNPQLPEQLRRLDIAADVQGGELGRDTVDALIMQRRSKARVFSMAGELLGDGISEQPETSHFERAGSVNAVYVGKQSSAVMLRAYDKQLELRERGPDKEQMEHANWAAGGWQASGASVWRFEFQLRSPALRDMKAQNDERSFRDNPRWALQNLDAIWRKLVGYQEEKGWLRLVVPGTAAELRRCKLDPRWDALRQVVWRDKKQEPARRQRVTKGPDTLQLLGTALSGLAKCRRLPDLDTRHDQGVLFDETVLDNQQESGEWLQLLCRTLADSLAGHLPDALVGEFVKRQKGDEPEVAKVAKAVPRAVAYLRNRWACTESRFALAPELAERAAARAA